MQFASAERILNASLLLNIPPIMIMGSNSIGKTEMLKTITRKFKHSEFTTSVEYGGLKQYIPLLQQHKTQTIVISDLQRIILRRSGVRDNTIGLISSLISEGTQFELAFSKDSIVDFKKRKKNYNLNFIIGCTPFHVSKLAELGYHDLLVRFIYVPVERDVSTIDFRKPFKPEVPIFTTYDKKKLQQLKDTDTTRTITQLTPRENTMYKQLQIGLKLLNVELKDQVLFYRPPDMKLNRNAPQYTFAAQTL